MLMSMASDYVSELWSPTGLLFILQVIYVCGKPKRNDIDREKLKNSFLMIES
jgi:hypothetical protein